MEENHRSGKFFQDLVSSLQHACQRHIQYGVSVELSGYLALEIDGAQKERYLISELMKAGGEVISESFCTKVISSTPHSSEAQILKLDTALAEQSVDGHPEKSYPLLPVPPLMLMSQALSDSTDSRSSLQMPINAKLPSVDLRSRSPEQVRTNTEHSKETFFAEDIVKLEPADVQIECEGSTHLDESSPGESLDKDTIISSKSDTTHALHSIDGHQNKHTISHTVVGTVVSPRGTGSNDVHLGHAIPVAQDSNPVMDESSFYEELETGSQDFVYRTRNKRGLLACQMGSLLEHPKQQKTFSRSSTCTAGSQETDPKNRSADVTEGGGSCVVSSGAKSLRKRSADRADASHMVKKGKVAKNGTRKQPPQLTIPSEENILQVQRAGGDKGIVQISDSSADNDRRDEDCDDDGDDCQVFFSELSNRRHLRDQLKSTPQSWAVQYALGILSSDEVDAILGLAEFYMSESTVRRTRCHVTWFYQFLHSRGENRHIETIPPHELDPLLGTFFTELRKTDGQECEPRYLKTVQCSLEGYLRFKGYVWSITTRDSVFQGSQEKLQRKVDQLHEQGKWGFVFDDMTKHDIDTFYKCGELGINTPNSLLNTVWFINCWNFGLKTFKEHARMAWGDLQLQKIKWGHEALVFTPGNGQTAITVPSDPKNPLRCPVTIYKRYRDARPPKTLSPEAPFYLGVNNCLSRKQDGSDKSRLPWFRTRACGNDRLQNMVRLMAVHCGIVHRRLCNGSFFKLISSIENGTHRDEPYVKHISQPTEIVWQAC